MMHILFPPNLTNVNKLAMPINQKCPLLLDNFHIIRCFMIASAIRNYEKNYLKSYRQEMNKFYDYFWNGTIVLSILRNQLIDDLRVYGQVEKRRHQTIGK